LRLIGTLVERIEGWRSLGDNIIETIINKSEKVKELKNKAKERDLTEKEKKELTAEEKEYKSKRKLVQEKLIKFATRIRAFAFDQHKPWRPARSDRPVAPQSREGSPRGPLDRRKTAIGKS
jgi:hypothetical protein